MIRSSFDSGGMFAFRTTTLLAAVVMTVIQPALALCECAGCDRGCATSATANDAVSESPSCCSHAEPASKSCCGARAGECPCGKCGDSGVPGSPTSEGGQSCSCSAPSPATAVESRAVQVDHEFSVHNWLTTLAYASAHDFSTTAAAANSADRGPPPRFGHLRLHAYLGVWIV
jgi:hypothetical protein